MLDWIKSNGKILDDCTEKWLIDFWFNNWIWLHFFPLDENIRNSFVIVIATATAATAE